MAYPGLAGPAAPEAWAIHFALFGMALTAAGAAVRFTLLQEFVLRRFCPYCSAVHAVVLTAVVASVHPRPVAAATGALALLVADCC